MDVVIPPVKIAKAVTPVWKTLYAVLSCSLEFNAAMSPLPKYLSAIASVSKPPMPMLRTFVTAAVPFIAFPSAVPHLTKLPAAPPRAPKPAQAAPVIAPEMAPENAPSSKPSRNEPPFAMLSSPPATPPIHAPIIAPQHAPASKTAPKPEPTPVHNKTTATTTIIAVTISFQCFLHHLAAVTMPSQICSKTFFSHSGFR